MAPWPIEAAFRGHESRLEVAERRRHNEEIKRRQNTQELKAKFSEDEVQLAITQVLNSSKFSHWKLKQNQANQALKACIRS